MLRCHCLNVSLAPNLTRTILNVFLKTQVASSESTVFQNYHYSFPATIAHGWDHDKRYISHLHYVTRISRISTSNMEVPYINLFISGATSKPKSHWTFLNQYIIQCEHIWTDIYIHVDTQSKSFKHIQRIFNKNVTTTYLYSKFSRRSIMYSVYIYVYVCVLHQIPSFPQVQSGGARAGGRQEHRAHRIPATAPGWGGGEGLEFMACNIM